MQLPHISWGRHSGACAQSGSAQSTRPSPSLSMPSLPCSGPQLGTSVWPQTPPVQLSVVQGFRSSQSAAVAQGRQPSWAACSQTLFAPQVSVVQPLPSSQSAAVVHGTQSAMVAYAQTPPSQVSVVQALPSSQSAAVVHALPVAAGATSTASRPSIAARGRAPRDDLVPLTCPCLRRASQSAHACAPAALRTPVVQD